jgi:hypothetical protein
MVQKPTGSGRLGGASSRAIQRITGVPSCGAVLTEDQPPLMVMTDMVGEPHKAYQLHAAAFVRGSILTIMRNYGSSRRALVRRLMTNAKRREETAITMIVVRAISFPDIQTPLDLGLH